MVDKGEKIPFSVRKQTAKMHFEDFKKESKAKLRGRGNTIMQLLILLLIAGVFLQSSGMIGKMNKLLGESEGSVHEIYDDSEVIKAYKTGNTEKLDEKELFVYDTMKDVIDELISDDMTDYDKEKAIYDWQVAWTNYSNENLNPITGGSSETHTPYGVLRSHNAICVGNATTFKLFMDALDIPCKIIHSTEYGEHAWDVVQLDGEWYHVDVTFDGTSSSEPRYTYFNVPDSMKDDGSWPWDHNEIPAANGTKYCYILQNAELLDDIYAIPAALKAKADSGDGNLFFKLKDSTGFTRNVADYIGNSIPMENGYIYFDSSYALNGEIVYKYYVENYSNSGDASIPDDVLQKLDAAVQKALYGDGVDVSNDAYDATGDDFYGLGYDDLSDVGNGDYKKSLQELTNSAVAKG